MISELENHLWQSTLFAGGVGLLTLMLRRNRAAVRHALWLAASVKFLVPFSLLIGVGSQVEWRKAPVVRPQVSFIMEEISHPFALPSPAAFASVPKAPSRVPAVLVFLWLCGFAANGLAWWRRWRRVRVTLRAASPLPLNLPIRVMSSPSRMEPGIFGIRKPVLLLPEGILDRLTPAQLQAIVAHELCHVRRRDNLAAAIHMVVEAMFWFYPLVWWLQARLVEERERACDEEVLRMAGDPQDYAEGILNVCKFYLESPLVCVSGVTGSNLKRRVEAIMMNREAHGLNFGRKLLLAVTGMLAVAVPIIVGFLNSPPALGQNAAKPPTFEVASVKPYVVGSRRGANVGCSNGRFLSYGFPLIDTIQFAYDLREFQLPKLPGWTEARDGYYEIEAKAANPVSESQCRLLVRQLLADSFKLAAHWGSKEISVYQLVVAKNGITMQKANESDEGTDVKITFNGRQMGTALAAPDTKPTKGRTMQELAFVLSAFTSGQPILDKTGIEGAYKVTLAFSFALPGQQPSDDPDLYTAVQQQLGLKLQAAKEAVQVLIVDDLERPSEN